MRRTDGHAAGDDVRGMYLGRGRAWEAAQCPWPWMGGRSARQAHGADRRWAQQMQNVTATGRKDGGAAMGKSGDDGDSAIVSDGEREATAPTHPPALARVHGHNELPSS